MAEINVSIWIEKSKEGEQCLYLKVKDTSWAGLVEAGLFSEVAEGLLAGTYVLVCYDLSRLIVAGSNVFGVCFNLINKARALEKKIVFRFNNKTISVVKALQIDKRVDVEEVPAEP